MRQLGPLFLVVPGCLLREVARLLLPIMFFLILFSELTPVHTWQQVVRAPQEGCSGLEIFMFLFYLRLVFSFTVGSWLLTVNWLGLFYLWGLRLHSENYTYTLKLVFEFISTNYSCTYTFHSFRITHVFGVHPRVHELEPS